MEGLKSEMEGPKRRPVRTVFRFGAIISRDAPSAAAKTFDKTAHFLKDFTASVVRS
ncbi:MAG: hypothetical protein IKR18_03425 [Bacteroidaceae bacterium]|nr:hypothetical protein [Bacteroidaceae bacterium]